MTEKELDRGRAILNGLNIDIPRRASRLAREEIHTQMYEEIKLIMKEFIPREFARLGMRAIVEAQIAKLAESALSAENIERCVDEDFSHAFWGGGYRWADRRCIRSYCYRLVGISTDQIRQ